MKKHHGAALPVSAPSAPSAAVSASPASAASVPSAVVELPKGCSLVQVATGTSVAFCPAPAESAVDKFLIGLPALLLSLVAVGISASSFVYGRRKDSRARKQSIQDDFWLRKVVSPVSIEPFLKYSSELCNSLPSLSGATPANVQAFWSASTSRSNEFALAFRSLALIDKQLTAAVAGKLEDLDDVVATYCGDLQAHLASSLDPCPNRNEAVRGINEDTISLLSLIQQHQSSVGVD